MERVAAVRTTRVTVETETSILFRGAVAVRDRCPKCGADVLSITFHKDYPAEPVRASEIQKWVGTDQFHYWLTVEGHARICLPSLLQSFEAVKSQLSGSKRKLFERWRKQQ
jgi:hypothetical protein